MKLLDFNCRAKRGAPWVAMTLAPAILSHDSSRPPTLRALGIILARLLPFCAAAQVPDDVARAAFEKVCGSCNDAEGATELRHTRGEWQSITDDTVSRGADATPQEVAAVVTWLNRRYGKVRINELDADHLSREMEITATEASAIVTYREKYGRFKDFEAVKEVSGIDPIKLESYKSRFIY
jgi:competence ComEA-like helix-hairpin-helix protein